jgi:hypothetical protein
VTCLFYPQYLPCCHSAAIGGFVQEADSCTAAIAPLFDHLIGAGGMNVGVATTLPTFGALGPNPEFPLGVTAGAYDQTFSLLDSRFYNPAFVTANGGTVAGAEAALIAGIEGEHTYFNIHTSNFPNGEIRAELLPIGVSVPAPIVGAGLPGVILACGALLALGRRRRQVAI